MNFAIRGIAAAALLFAVGARPALAGPTPASTPTSGTNRVDNSAVAGTNDVRHVPRWYEEPVKDPLTLLQEMQANAAGGLSEAPVFTMEDGLYSLISKPEHVAAPPAVAPDKLSAWDATPVRKEAPLDFSAVAAYRHASFESNGAVGGFVGELAKASSPQTPNTIEFHAANKDDTLEAPGKTRGLEDDGLPGPPPNVPLQPEPLIASPEPDILVLGILSFGAWRLVSAARRRE